MNLRESILKAKYEAAIGKLEFQLGIGIPCSFPMVPLEFFKNILCLDKPPFQLYMATYGHLDVMRNDIVNAALQDGCSHLLMIDADMTLHPKTIRNLIAHNLPIVGALCFRRWPPFDPLMIKADNPGCHIIEEWEPGSLVEVDATGTGCLMIKMEVFSKLESPWFRFEKNPETGNTRGEDIVFCTDARNAGYRIFVDTSVPAGHLTTMEVDESFYRLYKARDRAIERHREKEAGGIKIKI
jgi:hypothetical protein